MSEYAKIVFLLPAYNKIVYSAKIKKNNFERRFLETRKTDKSIFCHVALGYGFI